MVVLGPAAKVACPVTRNEVKGLARLRFFAEFIPSLRSEQALSNGRFFVRVRRTQNDMWPPCCHPEQSEGSQSDEKGGGLASDAGNDGALPSRMELLS